tara:strand:+ start:278 stop:493 length:216 start_codon:yes stop_codon:yes gene_type:complete
MRYLFILLLTGCATDQKLNGDARHEYSQLKCLGFCELVLTDKNASIRIEGKTDFKHGFTHDIKETEDEGAL